MTKQRKKAPKNKAKPRARKQRQRMVHGLDDGARKWAQLLVDPCNAPLCSPVFPSGNTSQYIRCHRYLNLLSGSNTDLQFFWSPNSNQYWFGQTIGSATGTLGAYQTLFDLSEFRSFRCAASCLKVQYVGAESARAGMVGLAVTAGAPVVVSSVIGTFDVLPMCPVVNRMGEVRHEVKWAPLSAQDAIPNTSGYYHPDLSTCLMAIVNGSTALAVQIEIVTVYEVSPAPSKGLIANAAPPPSRNNTNDVLAALGDMSRWAYGHVVVPTIKALASTAVDSVRTGIQGTLPLMLTAA